MVKDLCASAAKAALDTLNTGASTKFTSLKEAMIAFAEESKSNARRKIFLTRDDLVQDIVQITLNHNVNMEYTPTLKEVMTAFSLESRPDIDPNDDEYKEKSIFYKGDFVHPLWCALHSGSDAKSSHEPVASLLEVMKKAKQDGWMSSIENRLKHHKVISSC